MMQVDFYGMRECGRLVMYFESVGTPISQVCKDGIVDYQSFAIFLGRVADGDALVI